MQAARPNVDVRTFTVAMPDIRFDERAAAEAVASSRTEHTTVGSPGGDGPHPELPGVYDEPFADPSQIPSMLVAHGPRAHDRRDLRRWRGRVFASYNRYVLGATWRSCAGCRVPPVAAAARPSRSRRVVSAR
jgi:asparagine synthase (glutamine-hydrolysing)